ncbi:DUF1059 domain-containing protein [Spirillospora sp. NBC_00431]
MEGSAIAVGAVESLLAGRPAMKGGAMRKVADCRDEPSESGCTLTISGEEDEVVRAAAEHAASVHGHEDTPEFREQIRGMLKDEQPAMR